MALTPQQVEDKYFGFGIRESEVLLDILRMLATMNEREAEYVEFIKANWSKQS